MEEELEKKPEKKEMLEPERDSRRTAKSIYRRGMLAGIGCTLLIFAAIAGTVLWVRHDITRRKGDYRPGAGVLSEDFRASSPHTDFWQWQSDIFSGFYTGKCPRSV